VLDLTRLLPGPLCTQHLADMGADVIKIEAPQATDPARRLGAHGDVDAPLFALLNRNKRGLCLDLKQARGVALFKRLASGSHVIVESFRPGVVDRLGIGYPAIRPLNAELVYCAISGYGQTGDYRDRAGHDLNYCAVTGIVDQSGQRGGPPSLLNFQIADVIGGTLSAAMGILAALLDARSSGQGRYVDVSMSDCALAHAIFPMAALMGHGSSPERGADMLTGELPCYNLYPTADGRHMAVAALESKFWDRLCAALERPDLQSHHSAVGETGHRTIAELARIFGGRDQAHWIAHFAGIDCCVTPVLDMEETSRNPHFRQREMFVRSTDGQQQCEGFAFPLRFDGLQFRQQRAAPKPGEHNGEILGEMGLSPEEISDLRQHSVI